MIIDFLINGVFGIAEGFLSAIPVFNMEFDFSVLNSFLEVVGMLLWFFPFDKVSGIFAIIIMLQTWRITVSIFKTLWNVLPFL